MKRRAFLKTSTLAAFPAILPASVFAATPPSEKINIGCVGVGRMGMGDLGDFMNRANTRIVAVCDVDDWRVNNARQKVDAHYKESGVCAGYRDYRELLARPDIDVVSIVTPEHWHGPIAVEAARAGKDIFVQKPMTYTLREGQAVVEAMHRYGTVLLVGSQQRSDARFQRAVELVKNGYLGELKRIKVGLHVDPGCGPEPVQPVPEGFDYNFWLGPAPWAPYTQKRVHTPNGLSGRPGWLRCSDYCLGMITGWGSHHVDIAHWGAGVDRSGPIGIEGWGKFHDQGLWDVHGDFYVEMTYRNGPPIVVAGSKFTPHGITFEGSEGTLFVNRGRLTANPESILSAVIGPGDEQVNRSRNHKGNLLDCVKTRRETCAPVDIGHRSGSACILTHIGMRLQRPLVWDPDREVFPDDDEANRLLFRADRPWEALAGKEVSS